MCKPIFISLLIFFVIPFRSCNVQAQSVVIDSLNAIVGKPGTPNGQRIEAMGRLSKVMATQNKLEEALNIATDAQRLSYREKDGRYGALAHSALSYVYVQLDSLNLAFQAIDSAEWHASHTKDKTIQGFVRFRKGWVEYIVENTDKAYQHMLEALRILEEEKAYLYQSNIYHYLAAIYAYWKEPEKQLHYTRLCLEAAIKSGDPDAMADAYLTMGSSYLYRFRKDPSRLQLLDSSKYYNKRVLDLTKSKDKYITVPATEGVAALNMANLYFEFYPSSYKDSAEVYLNKALASGRDANHLEIIANCYGIMSEYALKEGDYDRAESLLQMAMGEILNSPKSGTLVKSRISNALARVAEGSGNTAKALTYYKQYMKFDKELFDEKKLSISRQLDAKYQSEKKEIALKAAEQEAAFTKELNRYYLILIIAGLMVLFFLFRSYHFKLKTSKQQQLLLTGEIHEAALHASLKAEETARLKAERELMQERLDRMEKELLAGTLQVEEKNTLLENLKEKLSSLNSSDPLYRQINRLISKNYEVDKDYSNLKTEFVEIRPGFVASLQKKAEDKLTRLDLKYCSYILMGLSNKEIAAKLNVDPKSIRMARYRLKQKLKLQKDESLDRFITDLGVKTVS